MASHNLTSELFTRFKTALDSRSRPLVMGVLNLTPDSFVDGGQFLKTNDALEHAQAMLNAGADIIDIGAESSRPGATVVSLVDELDRLKYILPECSKAKIPVSLDTYKPEVMSFGLNNGVILLNDIYGFTRPGVAQMFSRCRRTDFYACIMHMQGRPTTMQQAPSYSMLIQELQDFPSFS